MKLMKRCLLLLCALAFTVGFAGCEKSDMAPDDMEQSAFLEQLNR